MAGEEIGRAEIEVTADTSNFPRDVKRGVEGAFHDVDPEVKKTGEMWGEELSTGLDKRLKSNVPRIVNRAITDIRRAKLTEHVDLEVDYDKNRVKNTVRRIAEDVEREFTSGGAGGKITSIFTDAIGAAFNVSGKSPLTTLLIPVFASLAALITAAIEAVYGLGAALLTIPNLLAAIGVQAGVLFLIFKDVGGVLSKALAAENLTELQKALKGVNPYIANFAYEVVNIRDAFKAIASYASIAFFQHLGNILDDVFNFNRYTLFHGILDTAARLGDWFNQIGQAFETPEFAKFLADLFYQINYFLATNGPVLSKFLTQVFGFLDSLMGTTGQVGQLFNDFLKTFGDWLEQTSKSKDFQAFLAKMPQILTDSGRLIAALLDLILQLFSSIDKAGGEKFINALTQIVELLTLFFSTDTGIQSLRLLMGVILALTFVFAVLIIAVGDLLGWLQELFNWLGGPATKAVEDFFKKWGDNLAKGFSPHVWTDLKEGAKAAFEWLGDHGFEWGATLVSNFVRGLLSNLPTLKAVGLRIAFAVADAIPHSPAKVGPFSGDGAPYERGLATVSDFAKGIMQGGARVSTAINSTMSNNFGPGAVIANFYGQNPSAQQAQTLGQAVGNGISDQLASRNIRLAVRTM